MRVSFVYCLMYTYRLVRYAEGDCWLSVVELGGVVVVVAGSRSRVY